MLAAVGGAAGAAGIGLAAANPRVREEAERALRFARPLDRAAAGPLNPPPLPPGRLVAVPGRGELFVRDTGGDGISTGTSNRVGRPAVLLLHGWGATADANFFNAYPVLAEGYRVVAPDHRAHGRGPRPAEPFTLEDCADDAAALLGALGIGRAIAVGYSMGGPVALLLARRHPDKVVGLVLGATALEFNREPVERLLWHGLTIGEGVMRHMGSDGMVDRILRDAVDKEPALAPYRSWLAGELRRGDRVGIIDAGHALAEFNALDWAGSLHTPAAVVLTTADRLVAPRKQRALAAALGAPLFELEGDHDAPVTDGPDFATVMRAAVDWVAEQAGTPGHSEPYRRIAPLPS